MDCASPNERWEGGIFVVRHRNCWQGGRHHSNICRDFPAQDCCGGGGIGKDRIDDVVRSPNIFNSYVRPLTDMWEQRCIDVHQITSDDERIQSADGIERVLQQFTSSFYREVDTLETVVLVSN